MTVARAARWVAGAVVSRRELQGVGSEVVALPDRRQLVHLQFRRFAGCPMCDLHLRSIAKRHDELAAAGIREVAVFHSPAEELRAHGAAGLPFPVIADPTKRLYVEFGVEAAPRALFSPPAWVPVARAITLAVLRMFVGRSRPPALHQPHGRLGLPADFLIASDGTILACHYGEHVYDQWSVDDVLRHASARSADYARSNTSTSP